MLQEQPNGAGVPALQTVNHQEVDQVFNPVNIKLTLVFLVSRVSIQLKSNDNHNSTNKSGSLQNNFANKRFL